MEQFTILQKALEKAQQSGVFNLQEAVVVVNAINEVNKTLVEYEKVIGAEVATQTSTKKLTKK